MDIDTADELTSYSPCSDIEYDSFCVAARLFADGLISPHVYRDLSINRSNYDKA